MSYADLFFKKKKNAQYLISQPPDDRKPTPAHAHHVETREQLRRQSPSVIGRHASVRAEYRR
jgi:hypothetical protein